eukprot:3228884-Rhodomonas_salina.2
MVRSELRKEHCGGQHKAPYETQSPEGAVGTGVMTSINRVCNTLRQPVAENVKATFLLHQLPNEHTTVGQWLEQAGMWDDQRKRFVGPMMTDAILEEMSCMRREWGRSGENDTRDEGQRQPDQRGEAREDGEQVRDTARKSRQS